MREDRGRAHGRWRGLAGLRDDTPSHISATRRHCVEGTGEICRGAGGRWRGLAGLRDDAPSRRLAARTARGRAAAHRHTQRPSPPAPRTPVGPQATQPHSRVLRRPEHPWGHTRRRNTSGITRHVGITKPPGPTGAGRLSQDQRLTAGPRRCRGLRGRSPGERWKYRAWRQRPSRSPPCGDPRRRRWRSAWPSRQHSRRRCPRSRPG